MALAVMARTVASLSKEFEDFKAVFNAKLCDMSDALRTLKVAASRHNPDDVKELQKEVNEIKDSLEYISKQFESAKEQNESLAATNNKLLVRQPNAPAQSFSA